MKKIVPFLGIFLMLLTARQSFAQCAAGYNQATLNWDNLDYYYYTTTSPYGTGSVSYVSKPMEQTQRFALGPTNVTFALSASGIVNGINGSHTGNITNYGGNDVQFTPSVNGQTLTLTFASDVRNVNFALYDVDNNAKINLDAYDNLGLPQAVGITLQTSNILTITNNNSIATSITANSSNLTTLSDNKGTATVSIAGPIRKLIITFANIGGNAQMWMSKLYACIAETFPMNYYPTVAQKPFTGQPDYILTTPDNNSVYMLDPATGKAWFLFQETTNTYVNSLAYDPTRRFLYYTTDGSSSSSAVTANKQLKKYDFNTDTYSTVLADITSSLNIPTFDQGVESAAAAFYDGDLYLAIEGGRYSSSVSRKSIVYRLTLNSSGVPTSADQVYATANYNSSGTTMHDYGDFIVKDGVLIDFNTARSSTTSGGVTTYTYPNSSLIHYDMMSGTIVNTYTNPTSANPYVGQAALDYAGNLYSVRNVIQKYNMTGGYTTSQTISVVRGPAWVGNAGDATEGFNPKVDYGDAPASYDPTTGDPAVHEMDSSLKLGTGFDREWNKTGQATQANTDSYDDGISTVPVFVYTSGSYAVSVNVFNNTGSNATLVAWLDYNGNGKFDPSEGVTATVASKATASTVNLNWGSITSPLIDGALTYLRIRLTYASNNMTIANPTGYFNAGEVEDYVVPVAANVLSVKAYDFNAKAGDMNTVNLQWKVSDEHGIDSYIIEKSNDQKNWKLVNVLNPASKESGNYDVKDGSPLPGISYYRLKITNKDGKVEMSNLKMVEMKDGPLEMVITPNPVKDHATITLAMDEGGSADIQIINAQGLIVDQSHVILNGGTNTIRLNSVAKLTAGQYMVRVTTSHNTITRSLMITK